MLIEWNEINGLAKYAAWPWWRQTLTLNLYDPRLPTLLADGWQMALEQPLDARRVEIFRDLIAARGDGHV